MGKNKIVKYGSRRKVWNKTAKQTRGGIKRKDLYKDKYGRLKIKKSKKSQKRKSLKRKKSSKRKRYSKKKKYILKGGVDPTSELYTNEIELPGYNQDGTYNPGGPVETAEATTTDITEDASRTIIESEIIGQVGTPEAGGNTGITTIILESPVGQTDVVDGQIIQTTEESRQLNPAIMGIEIGSAR